jgi:hypothetical protein
MDLRRWISVGIAVGALVAAAVPAAAHGPVACVLLASPAQVNNTELSQPVGGAMNPTPTGHAGQKRGDGNRFGLYYPVTDPIATHWQTTVPAPPNHGSGLVPAFKGDHFNWAQSGDCENGGAYTAGGTGLGYCGRSVGYGTGSVNPGAHSTVIRWESAGTQLILLDSKAAGSVNAQANPPGSAGGSCLDGGASLFLVDGVIVHQ